MAISTPIDGRGLQQIILRADSELHTLQSENEALTKQVEAATAELSAIAVRQQARHEALQMAESTVTELRTFLETATQRARLSENTLAADDPGQSVKELEKRLKKADGDLINLRQKLGKESQGDNQRAKQLQRTLDQAHDALETNERTQQSIEAAREQAHRELGQVIQRAAIQRLQHLKEQVELRRAGIVKAEDELNAYAEEVRTRLAAYPDLLDELKPQLPFHDSSTVVIEAAIRFISTCLEQGRNAANIDSNVFRNAGLGQFADLFSVLNLSQDLFYGVLKGAVQGFQLGGPTELEERKQDLVRLLQAYREAKK